VPDDQTVEVPLGPADCFEHAVQHLVADGVHLGGDGENGDLRVLGMGPQAHPGVFPDGLALGGGGFAQHGLGIELAAVHRQGGTGLEALFGGGPGAGGFMHPVPGHDPGGQGRRAHGQAGIDVGLHGGGNGFPAGRLPGLEGAHGPAEAPAHGEIHIPGVVGDGFQVEGAVVEDVPVDGPQELGLFVAGGAQGGKLLGRVLDLEDLGHFRGNLAGGGTVILLGQVQHLDFLALLTEDAALGLLAQGALLDQGGQPGRGLEVAVPGVAGQGVLHGLDHVGQGVQAHHVGGAVGGALGTADLGAGQGIHLVEAHLQALGVVHHRQDGEDADPVGDEVGGVLGPHHALAEAGDQPGFQAVQHGRIGVGGGDDFHQGHVARRIEEVDAAEVGPLLRRHGGGQLVDGQARGVGGDDGAGLQVGRDLAVEVFLPLHLLGDGLDHQVALAQQGQVLLVVRGIDVGQALLARQGGRVQLLQAVQGLLDDAVGVALLGRQVEKHHRHIGVGEMGGDLGPHHAGAEHGSPADDQFAVLTHGLLVSFTSLVVPAWRACSACQRWFEPDSRGI